MPGAIPRRRFPDESHLVARFHRASLLPFDERQGFPCLNYDGEMEAGLGLDALEGGDCFIVRIVPERLLGGGGVSVQREQSEEEGSDCWTPVIPEDPDGDYAHIAGKEKCTCPLRESTTSIAFTGTVSLLQHLDERPGEPFPPLSLCQRSAGVPVDVDS